MKIFRFALVAIAATISLWSGNASAQSTPPQTTGECRFDIGPLTGPSSGDLNYLTDLASPDTANGMFILPIKSACGLPAAPLFISWARVQCDPQVGGQINVSIDRWNNGYNTGTGAGHQTGIDASLIADLVNIQPNKNPYRDVKGFTSLKVWDRTGAPASPASRLWFTADLPPGVTTYCALNIGFLQDNAIAITAATPGPDDPPPPSWTDIAGPAALNADTGSYAGYTVCQTIAAAAITDKSGATQTSVTFQAPSSGTLSIGAATIGPSAGGSNPCDVTAEAALSFNGSASGSASTGSTLMGTANSNVVPSASGLVVKAYVSSGALRYLANEANWQAYYALGNNAATPTGTTYTQAGAQAIGILSVEKE